MGTAPNARALVCPNCGGSIELRGFGRTLSAVCVQCLSILDTQSPELTVLQQFQVKERVVPLIPLGKRGKLHGDPWEVIGFQCRQILVELIPYEWREYVLFNPYKGFRYLTEYDGHWNDVKPITGVPEATTKSGKKAVKWMNETFTHFQSARAETTYVMGEFPWQVRVGETAMCEDYVSPPRMLSSEQTDIETAWSVGEYTPGKLIWEAFALPGSPPAAQGIYANQPSPYAGGVGSIWKLWLKLVAALVVILALASFLMQQKKVLDRNYTFTPGSPGEASFVTPVFALDGRPTNVEIDIKTDLDNQWAFFNLTLISEETGQGYDVGREVSYYHGTDSDGGWTEGDKDDSVLLPTVPAGRYYLRVEPDMEATPGAPPPSTVHYQISIRRDVPNNRPFGWAFFLLLIPPIVHSIKRLSFESRRWKESSYAGSGGGGGDDDGGSDD